MLAPARDLETGRAAVDCGADAVYIGGSAFGARHAAGNSTEQVAELARYAHLFGARVYATLNTLVFDGEEAAAERLARELTGAGVDALIVQDMAFLRMGLSGVEFHASTQTANIAPEDVAFLGRAGFRRVILERALSIDRIAAMRAATPPGLELEVFVHGAICVGYSGRCFMSRSSGPRSGNRGECSQPCRLAYDLTDGAGGSFIKGGHLLSVCDMDLSGRIGELLDAGVTSFKIEGRLKDVSYVRNIVGHYRRLIDARLALRPELERASAGRSELDFTPDPAKSFARGAERANSPGMEDGRGRAGGTGNPGEYFFDGAVRGVASFDTPKSVGRLAGVVNRVGAGFFTLKESSEGASAAKNPSGRSYAKGSTAGGPSTGNGSGSGESLSAGDGICFFARGGGKARGGLRGTNVNRVEGERIYPNRMEGIAAGTEIYRNYDRSFTRALERSRTRRRLGVDIRVEMGPASITVTFTDQTGVAVEVSREGTFEEARDGAKISAALREELSRSGDSIFEIRSIETVGEVRFAALSVIAELRREGLRGLLAAREELTPERRPAIEDPGAKFPRTRLASCENVTNRLAERFYRDHGVTEIAPPLELRPSLRGEVVMRSRYCIRREIRACLLNTAESDSPARDGIRRETGGYLADTPPPRGELFLERGRERYRLGFDCSKCEMTLIKE